MSCFIFESINFVLSSSSSRFSSFLYLFKKYVWTTYYVPDIYLVISDNAEKWSLTVVS